MKKIAIILAFAAVIILQSDHAFCQPGLPSLSLSGIASIKNRQLSSLKLPVPAHLGNSNQGNITAAIHDVCSNACATILPLTALELTGIRTNNYQVLLNWKTKNETASKGFDIERSLADATHFLLAGSAPSNNSTTVEKKYTQTDANSYAGISFYRIKQIDLDGNFAYSNTIQVKGYDSQESIWLSPNPASSTTTLFCYTASASKAMVKIITAHGQCLYEKVWMLSAGGNQLRLPVAQFAAGMYYVQLVWPDGHRTDTKLVVK